MAQWLISASATRKTVWSRQFFTCPSTPAGVRPGPPKDNAAATTDTHLSTTLTTAQTEMNSHPRPGDGRNVYVIYDRITTGTGVVIEKKKTENVLPLLRGRRSVSVFSHDQGGLLRYSWQGRFPGQK
jgi:hypothetical protein